MTGGETRGDDWGDNGVVEFARMIRSQLALAILVGMGISEHKHIRGTRYMLVTRISPKHVVTEEDSASRKKKNIL